MATKKELQTALDLLRHNPLAFQEGTDEYMQRVKLEQLLDNHLYDKEK